MDGQEVLPQQNAPQSTTESIPKIPRVKSRRNLGLLFLAALILLVFIIYFLSFLSNVKAPEGSPLTPLGKSLVKSYNITSASYLFVEKNILVKMKGEKVWFKKNDSDHIAYNIYNPDLSTDYYYSVNPKNLITVMYPYSQAELYLTTSVDFSKRIDINTLNFTNDTYEGKAVFVVNYNSTRYWVDQDKGVVLKLQLLPDGATVTYAYFDFSDIPDSVFELPQGAIVR